MKFDCSIRPSRVSAAVLAALMIWTPAGAIRFDWTAAEIECAQSIGIDLTADPEPGSSGYVKLLAWLSDLIVTGTVAQIRHDIKGPYPTLVQINVLSVKKGQLPADPLTVALLSGPQYNAALDLVLETRLVNEPSFVGGETVLLFLTKGTIGSDPGQSYELPTNYYRLVNSSKFHISGGTAILQGWGAAGYNLTMCGLQINSVVLAQSNNCQDGPQE